MPKSAKPLRSILLVAAIVGVIGYVWWGMRAEDAREAQDLQAQLEQLEVPGATSSSTVAFTKGRCSSGDLVSLNRATREVSSSISPDLLGAQIEEQMRSDGWASVEGKATPPSLYMRSSDERFTLRGVIEPSGVGSTVALELSGTAPTCY